MKIEMPYAVNRYMGDLLMGRTLCASKRHAEAITAMWSEAEPDLYSSEIIRTKKNSSVILDENWYLCKLWSAVRSRKKEDQLVYKLYVLTPIMADMICRWWEYLGKHRKKYCYYAASASYPNRVWQPYGDKKMDLPF